MTKPQIRVLIVEDDTVDRLACRRAIATDPDYDFVLFEAATGREGLQSAILYKPDCILLDYHLPDLNGLEFLSEMSGETGITPMPVMLLTGTDSATVAATAIKRGAWDYLGKDIDRQYLEFLPAAIKRMVREQQLAEGKRQAEAKFRSLVEQIEAITYIVALDALERMFYISPQIRVLGFSSEEWLSTPELHARQIHAADRAAAMQVIKDSRDAGSSLRHEYRMMARNGEVLWFRDEAKAVTDEAGNPLFLQGILIDITQDKLIEQALRHSQAELRQLAGYIESTKEAERKRIAQEIHDELGSILTGIKIDVSVYLERAERAGIPADPLLVDAVTLANSGFQALRHVITELRPSVLDELGVWAALEWHAAQIEKRFGLQCTCVIDASAAAVELEAELDTMLFRVVQEALTNVVRHAEASKVSIKAKIVGETLFLEVRDNGKGMDTAPQIKRESWGFVGMQERARYFGGELTITGKAGEGTVVLLRLSMEKAA